MKPMYVKI